MHFLTISTRKPSEKLSYLESGALLPCSDSLPAGSRALPAGERVIPAGSEALPAGFRALPAGSKPPPVLLCGGTIGHRPLRGRCPLTTKLTK